MQAEGDHPQWFSPPAAYIPFKIKEVKTSSGKLHCLLQTKAGQRKCRADKNVRYFFPHILVII